MQSWVVVGFGISAAACSFEPPPDVADDAAVEIDAAESTEETPVLESCRALHEAGVDESGVYRLDPGDGGDPLDAYCDMVTDGGGWTLVMKLSTATKDFEYDAVYWDSEALLEETDLVPNTDPKGRNAKLVAFNRIAGDELRLEWMKPVTAFVVDVLDGRTALELFRGPEIMIAGNESNACNGQLLRATPAFDEKTMRHGSARQFFGINGNDTQTSSAFSQMRFGYGSSDEPQYQWWPYQGIGVQACKANNSCYPASLKWTSDDETCTEPGECPCYGTEYAAGDTGANLWVR
jgi:hypothetical protein